jgi:hypothetical protein
MNASAQQIRVNVILGRIAVVRSLHSLIFFVGVLWVIGSERAHYWHVYFFATVAVTWFAWPFVLAFHSGRSWRRVLVPVSLDLVLIALVVLHPYVRRYSLPLTSQFPDSPSLVSISPLDIIPYAIAYEAGRFDAKRDIKTGELSVEKYGFGTHWPDYWQKMRDKYQIEIRSVADCNVTPRRYGHARGYNRVSVSEIERRYGKGILASLSKEAQAHLDHLNSCLV